MRHTKAIRDVKELRRRMALMTDNRRRDLISAIYMRLYGTHDEEHNPIFLFGDDRPNCIDIVQAIAEELELAGLPEPTEP